MAPKRMLLVRAADYNGSKDVLFMMEPDDFRLRDPVLREGWTVLNDHATYTKLPQLLQTEDGFYKVHIDWSLTPLF